MTKGIRWSRDWWLVGLVPVSAVVAWLAILGINHADANLALGLLGMIALPLAVAAGVSAVVGLFTEIKRKEEQAE